MKAETRPGHHRESKVLPECTIRPRCPHDNKLLDKRGICWACGKTPEQWKGPKLQKVELDTLLADRVDTHTGEIHPRPGQLLLMGFDLPTKRKVWNPDALTVEEIVLDGRLIPALPESTIVARAKGGVWLVKLSTVEEG